MAVRPCDVTALIGTFGSVKWTQMADRAAKSALAVGCSVSLAHEDTLAKARTVALQPVDTPWVVHLDADDWLGRRYFDGTNNADVQPTMIHYVSRGMIHRPSYPQVAGHAHECSSTCLPEGNYVHIGAIMRTELARELVWHEHEIYEDWCWWVQAFKKGATFSNAPGIYEAEIRRDSRNRTPPRDLKKRVHHEIAVEHFPERDWGHLLA